MKGKFFIAGMWARRHELEQKSEVLRRLGYDVVSRRTWFEQAGMDDRAAARV